MKWGPFAVREWHADGGDLRERPGLRRPRQRLQPLQLQLGRRLRRRPQRQGPHLRRHPHLLARMPLPVRNLPRRQGLPDHLLQGLLLKLLGVTTKTATNHTCM